MAQTDVLSGLSPDKLTEYVRLKEALVQLKNKDQCREDFMSFVKTVWPDFVMGKHHQIYAEKLQRIADGSLRRLIVNMPPRHCLALDTPIMTTTGWKTMATIETGDYVFGPDGQPTMVLGKSEIHRGRRVWRASTDDGASILCDDGHLWSVALCRKRRVFKKKTAKYLADRQKNMSEKRPPRLPDQAAVDYSHKNLLIDPYTFGVWLGDGSQGQATITMHNDDQGVVRQRIEQAGFVTTSRRTRFTFGVLDLKSRLADLGVLNNKHIPAEYLMASKVQRLALLDGLMDTDGNVSKARQCFLATSSPVLRDQYRELLWSLGIKNGLSTSRAIFNGRDYGETYRIGFYAKDVGTLPRKRERATGRIKDVGRYLSFEEAGTADVQCIEVARKDGLFLAGHGFIPTSNTKSEFASYLFPAFMIGRNPKLKIIQTTHTADLSVRFGRKVRNLVDTSDYRAIFPEVHMRSDSKASGRWDTDAGGEYYAAGIGGAISGRGANLLIIDDPHSEQDAMSATALDAAYEWYISGPRQRLQPGGAIVLVMTRWGNRDLTSRLLKDQSNEKADQWEVVEFPAIFPETNNPLWPEFWNLEELEKVKASLTVSAWSAQWMQNPSAEESAILKREYWRIWEKKKPPECNYILQSYDTAFSKKAKADYSACTTWGVFTDQDEGQGIILLDSWKERLDFPELKKRAYDEYNYWNPDMILIEAKAAGTPLTHELRKIGLPVSNFTPSRGNDKIARAHGAAAVFESGLVWAPENKFAQELIEECAAFPAGDSDDLVDSTTQAILRFRQGGFIRSETDYELESSAWREPRSYY